MAPHTGLRSERPGEPGALLVSAGRHSRLSSHSGVKEIAQAFSTR